MTARVGTLKGRLAGWLLATVGLLGTLLLVEAYTGAQRAADRAYDSQLEAASLSIAEAVQWQDGQPIVEMPAAALQILATDAQERVFYGLLTATDQPVTGNLSGALIASVRNLLADGPAYARVQSRGTPVRLYGRELMAAGWEATEPVEIWVGHTVAGRKALALELFLGTLARFVVMVLLTVLLLMLAVRMALQPLRRLRSALRSREADDVSPLNARVPGELSELVDTLNALFERQREGRNTLLRFTADASHQLKTPLAGLQSASELALQSDNPEDWRRALQTVHDSSERTSRLAGQLLSLARLGHGTGASHTRLELRELLRETVLEWAEREVARNHDVGLAALPATPCVIRGEPWALRELLANLIDNALRYTPAGSEITLALERSAQWITLSIADTGPGVSQEVLHRLHQPFERGGRQDTGGSGLGLAIVDSIARLHKATLLLRSEPGQGLWVGVRFPAEPAEVL
ncbi:sensor histidine kinase [Marinobacter sp. X15-166B]|uniref:sensor histidine kinase n=1 Tax=Marinobacter sp. X15-166B TaxID=1897620 RepID=UPI00085C5CF8|nr:sensor histidine kinase [Marinobacter sp. X15-166B]OEY65414.1 histidine kinase [Marinobacter sp. X15-166B]